MIRKSGIIKTEREVKKMKKHFWVVIVKDKSYNVSQEIYNDYENAKKFVLGRSGKICEGNKFSFFEETKGTEYEIKGVEVGD